MKLLVFALVCCGTSAIAQNNENALLQDLKKKREQKVGSRSYVSPFIKEAFTEKLNCKFRGPQAFEQNFVTTLPLDKMPCVVPNMKNHTAMPNVGDSSILKHPIDPGIYAYKRRFINNELKK